MRYYARKSLLRNMYHPSSRAMGTICKKTFSSFPSMAILASLGFGLTFLLSYKPSLFRSAKRSPSYPTQNSSSEVKTYFDAAPRSVSGRHPSYRDYAGIGGGVPTKKSGQFAVISAALLTMMYFFGRKK